MEANKNQQNRKLDRISYSGFDELYESIRKEGSLGLLALGHHGLLLWRKKRVKLGVLPPKPKTKEDDAKTGEGEKDE